MVLGIDIGGTSLKFGVVNAKGDIVSRKKYDTTAFVKNGFENSLAEAIKEYKTAHPEIVGVGMGFPGLLSADRKNVVLLPNIPGVKDLAIVDYLSAIFPDLKIKIENDAKCACLGEYQFGANKGQDDFLFVTLGTGVGSGAIINKHLFIGGRGNGMEIGHMLLGNGKTLEQQVGLNSLLNYAKDLVKKKGASSILYGKELSMHALCDAASAGDSCAKELFDYLGNLLGQTIVSVIRVLDINTIIIGGGISNAFSFFVPELESAITSNLPEYYTRTLQIKKASLSNDAGLLGAAGLIMIEHEDF
jgi:glucokinase